MNACVTNLGILLPSHAILHPEDVVFIYMNRKYISENHDKAKKRLTGKR